MKKRLLSFVLCVVIVCSVWAVPISTSAAGYSVYNALAYAKEHWNDNVGLCAEFVSRCVRAGGLDIKVIATVTNLRPALKNASGLDFVDLKTDSKGYVTKALNGDNIAPGDVVIQYCFDHSIAPHILLFAGYNSSGQACYYAHNGALNFAKYSFKPGPKYYYREHTPACNMGAKVIRLSTLDPNPSVPGPDTANTNSPKASFSPAKDAEYVAKAMTSNTNAVVVNQVNKLSGVKVTQMGIYVYDANGSLIKRHSENISNVGSSTTKYHSWYDMQGEAGITLTPGTTYKYAFFGVFDGEEIIGDTYSFKTTGTAPQPEVVPERERCEAKFVTSMSGSDLYFDAGSALGELPEPIVYEGYTFDGYYTSREGGEKVTSDTVCNGDTTYYARFTPVSNTTTDKKDFAQGIVVENGFDEKSYHVYFWSNGAYLKSKEVVNGEKFGTMPDPLTLSGQEFIGYYTKEGKGGQKVTENTTVDLSDNLHLYARFEDVEEESGSEYTEREEVYEGQESEIILSIGSPYLYLNGRRKNIDNEGTKPFINNGRTLLPVRAVFEAMGGNVEWNSKSKVVSLKLDGYTVFLKIDETMAWDSNGEYYDLDTSPIISNGRTMLPIRFVVEAFGGNVEWDNDTQSVIINYQVR